MRGGTRKGKEARKRRFFNVISGFDVVAFDEYLQTPDGVSTKQHIETKYDIKAVVLIENLIG